MCRAGRLFDVEEWIAAGKRFQMPEGIFATWPLRVAVKTGFHSLVEVFFRASVNQDEKDYALSQAMADCRLDFIDS